MTDHGDQDLGDLPPIDPELAAWLAAEPAPTMPPAVWERLEARLAAEPAIGSASLPAGVTDLDAERSKRRGTRVLLPVLAGAAGLVLVGAVVIPSMRAGDAPPVADVNGAEPAMVAGAESSEASPSGDTSPGAPMTTPSVPRTMVETGTDYSAETMTGQVTALLAAAGLSDAAAVSQRLGASPEAMAMSGPGFISSPEALADCLSKLGLPAESTPLLVDSATYDGQQAGVVVTVGSTGADGAPTTLHVVAVEAQCDDDAVATASHMDIPLPPAP